MAFFFSYLRRRRRQRLRLALACLVTCLIPPSLAFWPFSPKRFSGNSLIDAGMRGLSGEDRVIAFGDFNGDQFLDILTLADDQQTMTVYIWNHETFVYEPSASFRHPSKVHNVVPGDFTHSGKLDLLVMSQSSTGSQIDMLLYPAQPGGGFDVQHPMSVPSSSSLVQPIPVDLNGDMKIDLLGMSKDGYQVWQNVWDTGSTLFNLTKPNFDGAQCKLAYPHSNAVVDLNGDCLADIFLLCENGRNEHSYQIWVNQKKDGFVLAQQGSLPSGVQTVSFADMDRDGTIDMVFTTCSYVSSSTGLGSDCYINIAYNQQLPLCKSSMTPSVSKDVRTCRPPEDLCVADKNFKFDMTPGSDTFARFPFSDLFPGQSLLALDTTFSPPLPQSIKLGDFNLDGFPDMLLVAATSSDKVPQLVLSVPCAKGVPGCGKDGTGRRGWKVVQDGTTPLQDVTDARSVSFLDMDEDGTLDIMVQRTDHDGYGKILFVQNNFYYDAFFLKAIVLNGACDNGWCYNANGTIRYHPFGVSYSGASYKYTVLDTSNRRSAAQVGQLPQTSYQALQTPYSFFGLGRTNNYIENLFVGATIHAQEHYINMEGVIPNSKVVILPPPREGDTWKRELFLRPGDWIPWVTLTVVIGMFLLAIIVLVLHLSEKREDELERRRTSHRINFDAL